MTSGGYRPGSGRSRVRPLKKSAIPKEIRKDARAAKMKPLEYMLSVMNDEEVDVVRRDRMAIAAAPFCHVRVADSRIGKKEQAAEEARTAADGTDWEADMELLSSVN